MPYDGRARPSSRMYHIAGGRRGAPRLQEKLMYFTYVLLCRDEKLYIGFSGDLKERIHEHEGGNVAATQHRRPVTLIYYEACLSKEAAMQRERYFKTGFGRQFLKKRLNV